MASNDKELCAGCAGTGKDFYWETDMLGGPTGECSTIVCSRCKGSGYSDNMREAFWCKCGAVAIYNPKDAFEVGGVEKEDQRSVVFCRKCKGRVLLR